MVNQNGGDICEVWGIPRKCDGIQSYYKEPP